MRDLLLVLLIPLVPLLLSTGCQSSQLVAVHMTTGFDTQISDGGERGHPQQTLVDPRNGHGHGHTVKATDRHKRANTYHPWLGAVGTWYNGARAGIKTGVRFYDDGQGQDSTISTWLEWPVMPPTPDSIVEKVLSQ